MKKIAILFLCLMLFPGISVFASEKESLEQFAGTDTLWNQLPRDVDENALRELLEEKKSENFAKKLWESIFSFFSVGIHSGIRFFAKLCTLILFAALFYAAKDSFRLKGLEHSFDFLLLLCLSLICFSSLRECLALANSALQAAHSFFLASLPITTMLLTLSGSPTAAGTMAASINFAITAVSTLLSTYLSPLLNTLFAFSAADGILDGTLSGMLGFLKKMVKVLCILFFTLISATLAMQNALATAADSVAMRSVRFAAGTFIPVVGPLVGESAKTLAASFTTVKAECGILFVLVLIYVLLRPILNISFQKLFLGIASAFAEILSIKSIQGYLKAISGLMDLLMALLISEGCYLIFYITLFITNRGGLHG